MALQPLTADAGVCCATASRPRRRPRTVQLAACPPVLEDATAHRVSCHAHPLGVTSRGSAAGKDATESRQPPAVLLGRFGRRPTSATYCLLVAAARGCSQLPAATSCPPPPLHTTAGPPPVRRSRLLASLRVEDARRVPGGARRRQSGCRWFPLLQPPPRRYSPPSADATLPPSPPACSRAVAEPVLRAGPARKAERTAFARNFRRACPSATVHSPRSAAGAVPPDTRWQQQQQQPSTHR
ncbi:uncharacterized protein LOC126474290 [Schistocerca serialis cubense]|uniref:uncharacterized protein LOC126474290 n=1 Tax=Schistocerca serialis cubense TaxID=2023355 RepID=UPI00214EA06A|nr:uncharacterized protein LOC126474290 [Schistocerca serialis cubense]